jgi:hypothetical protein
MHSMSQAKYKGRNICYHFTNSDTKLLAYIQTIMPFKTNIVCNFHSFSKEIYSLATLWLLLLSVRVFTCYTFLSNYRFVSYQLSLKKDSYILVVYFLTKIIYYNLLFRCWYVYKPFSIGDDFRSDILTIRFHKKCANVYCIRST